MNQENKSDSPVSNNGRGLKPITGIEERRAQKDSPVSNNGRGLKPAERNPGDALGWIRPLAITGVD